MRAPCSIPHRSQSTRLVQDWRSRLLQRTDSRFWRCRAERPRALPAPFQLRLDDSFFTLPYSGFRPDECSPLPLGMGGTGKSVVVPAGIVIATAIVALSFPLVPLSFQNCGPLLLAISAATGRDFRSSLPQRTLKLRAAHGAAHVRVIVTLVFHLSLPFLSGVQADLHKVSAHRPRVNDTVSRFLTDCDDVSGNPDAETRAKGRRNSLTSQASRGGSASPTSLAREGGCQGTWGAGALAQWQTQVQTSHSLSGAWRSACARRDSSGS